jgi:hypothetical protein
VWHPKREHPPLSARAAERTAWTVLEEMFGNVEEWKREEITLIETHEANRWVYQVTFQGPRIQPDETRPALTSALHIFVLMNGLAIQPKLEVNR